MAIPFFLMAVGSLMIFLGLLNGDITTAHDISKFGGIVLVAIGILASARTAAKRRQDARLVRIQAGLPQSEPLGREGGAHY
ncbi:hypothetical protein SAMN06264364_10593 [Quadrisphaera granulorum]|uniref:Uncharacterized protein n=1 Tax=Quadrisphaera granulorum TaxID=317664 RepID=A0A316AAF0_9ACTN|nr:hypothetical protein [Quadrisphaera granulorum]PWJ54886.1 hypothetical protein BXY45_10593 [Quadrisphaera granulorum]SZE95832.1 hypothetical protein SAMN06264364_10593 [Quadrisphaera granulorum]